MWLFLVLVNCFCFFCPDFRVQTLDVTGQTFLTPDLLKMSQGRLNATRAEVLAQLNYQAPTPVILILVWRPIEPTIQVEVGGCN
jgi:hypothetical protein